jgi:ribonuclease HI
MEEESSWDDGNGRRSVKIHKENLPRLASDILAKKKQNPSWIEWDEENWHYSADQYKGPESQRKERVALYILALDAINFCFWPPRAGETRNNSLEYDTLAVALKKMAEADESDGGAGSDSDAVVRSSDAYAFSPKNLAAMTPEKVNSLLQPHLNGHYLDNIEKRSHLWKEVGEVLLEKFDGSATQLLTRADTNASKLVELVFQFFPGFRDEAELDDNRITFLKRAQIFVGDVNAALKLGLEGMEKLTTFADYRVPQILRHFDIIEYSPALAHIVDSEKEITKSSADEISIRAATVTAVEELVTFLNSGGASSNVEPLTSVTVDWYLWQVAERMHHDGLLKPFHKVRTQFY